MNAQNAADGSAADEALVLPIGVLLAGLPPLQSLLYAVLSRATCPTQRELGELLSVSRSTIQAALAKLTDRGFLAMLPRCGGRENRYITLPIRKDSPKRLNLLKRVLGSRPHIEGTYQEQYFRTEHYQEYLRTFCRKPNSPSSRS